MKYNIPGFSRKGSWFKGNLHTHTNLFDGYASPEEVIRLYRDGGYDFLAVTDHNMYRAYPQHTSEEFLMIYGTELTPGIKIDWEDEAFLKVVDNIKGSALSTKIITAEDPYEEENTPVEMPDLVRNNKSPHVIAISRQPSCEPWDAEESRLTDIQSMIQYAQEKNCMAIVAHPAWSKLDTEDLLKLENYTAIEVYNHVCENLLTQGEASVYWDCMMNHGKKVFAGACDDMHNPEVSLGGYLMLKAEALTYEKVVEAIENGDYYSSAGPVIEDIQIENRKVTVFCSEAREVRFITSTLFGRTFVDPECRINSCVYTLSGNETYLRVEVVDREGRKAWSNPVFF